MAPSTCQPRFTYEFFHDIKNEQEGRGYLLVFQFKTEGTNCVTPEEWEHNKFSQLTDTKAALNENRMKYFYNPFITVYDLSAGAGPLMELEVHLPLYPFTLNGMPTAVGASSDDASWNLWFVSAQNAGLGGTAGSASMYYPFAMDIPYYEGFYPSREMTPISESYPNYRKWQLGGQSDWYKHRAANRTQPFTLSRSNWIYYDHNVQNDYDK